MWNSVALPTKPQFLKLEETFHLVHVPCQSFRVFLKNFHTGGISSSDESILRRSQFLLRNQCLGIAIRSHSLSKIQPLEELIPT